MTIRLLLTILWGGALDGVSVAKDAGITGLSSGGLATTVGLTDLSSIRGGSGEGSVSFSSPGCVATSGCPGIVGIGRGDVGSPAMSADLRVGSGTAVSSG